MYLWTDGSNVDACKWGWVSKIQQLYNMGYYADVRNNRLDVYTATCVELKLTVFRVKKSNRIKYITNSIVIYLSFIYQHLFQFCLLRIQLRLQHLSRRISACSYQNPWRYCMTEHALNRLSFFMYFRCLVSKCLRHTKTILFLLAS